MSGEPTPSLRWVHGARQRGCSAQTFNEPGKIDVDMACLPVGENHVEIEGYGVFTSLCEKKSVLYLCRLAVRPSEPDIGPEEMSAFLKMRDNNSS